MSRKADREDRVIDRLERENRELKSTVRSLQKRLARVTKGYRGDSDIPQEKPKKKEPPKETLCHECRQGNLTEVELIGRIIESCDFCEYRKTRTKRKETSKRAK